MTNDKLVVLSDCVFRAGQFVSVSCRDFNGKQLEFCQITIHSHGAGAEHTQTASTVQEVLEALKS